MFGDKTFKQAFVYDRQQSGITHAPSEAAVISGAVKGNTGDLQEGLCEVCAIISSHLHGFAGQNVLEFLCEFARQYGMPLQPAALRDIFTNNIPNKTLHMWVPWLVAGRDGSLQGWPDTVLSASDDTVCLGTYGRPGAGSVNCDGKIECNHKSVGHDMACLTFEDKDREHWSIAEIKNKTVTYQSDAVTPDIHMCVVQSCAAPQGKSIYRNTIILRADGRFSVHKKKNNNKTLLILEVGVL